MDNNHEVMDSYESTENALLDSFKAAALKVTTLYKDSLAQNRKAYAAGYQQALQDLYEFLSSTQQPEQGFVPVEDVLQFARQKNNQLVTEMKGSSHSQPTPPPAPTVPPAPSSVAVQKEPVYQKPSPFQIDPHAQFTFTHDLSARNHDVWDAAAHLSDNNNNKRRLFSNEVSFLGRSMDVWHEQQSPFKRGRTRREDPQDMLSQSQSMQAQHQLAQHSFQQQQQEQQLQAQQQQQQQQSFQLPFFQQPPPPL